MHFYFSVADFAQAGSRRGSTMAVLQLSDMDQYADFLHRQLSETPGIGAALLCQKLIQEHAASCKVDTMRSWLDRARAIVPKRALKRGSSDLPNLENPEEHGDYLRGLLVDNPALTWWSLREAMKKKGFFVKEMTMRHWLERHYDETKRALIAAPKEGLTCLDVAGLRLYEAHLLKHWNKYPSITYTAMKEYLEQSLAMTCTKSAMQNFMLTPRKSFAVVTIDELRKAPYLRLLRAYYSDPSTIKLHVLRMKLEVNFERTASDVTMRAYMALFTAGVSRRLRTKTTPIGPIVDTVVDLSPYLDELYVRIAEEPTNTWQRLSADFVYDHCKFFDPISLKEAIARLKRRHAIFEAWRNELDKDFGLVRKDGLPSLQLPKNIGSMSEYEFYLAFDCGKSCHRCGVRTFPSFGAPPIVGNPFTANKHMKANSLSYVCRPCCGSPLDVLESEGPKLSTDAFYYTPQFSDWPVYDTVNDVFKL